MVLMHCIGLRFGKAGGRMMSFYDTIRFKQFVHFLLLLRGGSSAIKGGWYVSLCCGRVLAIYVHTYIYGKRGVLRAADRCVV